MENTGLALALPIQIGASIGFGLAQDWLIGPNWHALATPQRGMPIHVNPVQSANPRPIQNTAETVRPPDWHGLADWIFKKGEYFTLFGPFLKTVVTLTFLCDLNPSDHIEK